MFIKTKEKDLFGHLRLCRFINQFNGHSTISSVTKKIDIETITNSNILHSDNENIKKILIGLFYYKNWFDTFESGDLLNDEKLMDAFKNCRFSNKQRHL